MDLHNNRVMKKGIQGAYILEFYKTLSDVVCFDWKCEHMSENENDTL